MSNCSCCGSRCKCTVSCCNGCAPYYMVNVREGSVIYYSEIINNTASNLSIPRYYSAYEAPYWYITDPGELYVPQNIITEYSNKNGYLRVPIGADNVQMLSIFGGTSAPSLTEYSVNITIYGVETYYRGSDMTAIVGGRESELFEKMAFNWNGREFTSTFTPGGPLPPTFQIPAAYAIPLEIFLFAAFNGKTYVKKIASISTVNTVVNIPFNMQGFQEVDVNAAPLPYTQSIPNGGSVSLESLDYSTCKQPTFYCFAQSTTTRLSTAPGLTYFNYQYPGQPATPGFSKKSVSVACKAAFKSKMTLSGLKMKTYSICNHNTGSAIDRSGTIELSTGISVDESNVPGAPECLIDGEVLKLEKGKLCDGTTTNNENIVTIVRPIACNILNDSDDDRLVAEYNHRIAPTLSPYNQFEVIYNETYHNYDSTMIETTCGRFPPILRVVYVNPHLVSGYYVSQSGTIEYSTVLSNSDFAVWTGQLVDMWGNSGVKFKLQISIVDRNNYYKVVEIYQNGGLMKRTRCKDLPLTFVMPSSGLFQLGLTVYIV